MAVVIKYQPAGRAGHRSNAVGNKLYVWSGEQRDRPKIHSSEAKQRYNSRVEILDLITGNWRQCPTTGNPPLGFTEYASAVIDNNIIYFGGWCGHEGCYHNSLTSLCVDTMQWKELSPTNPHTGPMMKSRCGMIPVKIDGKYFLLVIGGRGPSINTPRQDTALYSDKGMPSGYIRTNEQHYFNLSTGQWISPIASGDCPPPCDRFTLTSLTDDTFIMFGGITPKFVSDAVYIGNCTQSKIIWQKVNSPSTRDGHDTAALDEHNIIMIGGLSTSGCNDCWIFNIKTKLWKKLTLPLLVTELFWHSVSSFNVTSDIVWVIVFGGQTVFELYLSDTTVIELIHNDDGEWCVGEVMTHPLNDYELKLTERKKQSNHPPVNQLQVEIKQLQVEIKHLHQKLQESNEHIQQLSQRVQQEHQEKLDIQEKLQKVCKEKEEIEQQLKRVLEEHDKHTANTKKHNEIDTKRMKQIIDRVLVSQHAVLTRLPKTSLSTLANELYASNLVSVSVIEEPSMNNCIEEFKSCLAFVEEYSEIQNYCNKFIQSLTAVGGPYKLAGDKLKQEWKSGIETELNISFIL